MSKVFLRRGPASVASATFDHARWSTTDKSLQFPWSERPQEGVSVKDEYEGERVKALAKYHRGLREKFQLLSEDIQVLTWIS